MRFTDPETAQQWDLIIMHEQFSPEITRLTKRKGITSVELVNGDSTLAYKAAAWCSRKDTFTKRIGRERALERLLDMLPPRLKFLTLQTWMERPRG